MRAALKHDCKTHEHPEDCADSLVGKLQNGTYGLRIHDGGSSVRTIQYCPWCAAKLPCASE